MEYFKLVKWMIFLNLLLCVPMLFIIIPQLTMEPHSFDDKYADSSQAGAHSALTQNGERTTALCLAIVHRP